MSNIIDTLIYDRTEADVVRVATLREKALTQGWSALTAEEKAEWSAGMRGAYNAADMNRVGGAVAFIAGRFTDIPDELDAYREEKGVADSDEYHVPYDPSKVVVSPKTDWVGGANPDTPTDADAAVYLGNLSVLRSIIPLPADTPAVPASLSRLTWETANAIEYLLYVIYTALSAIEQDLYTRIDATAAGFMYAGEFTAGE